MVSINRYKPRGWRGESHRHYLASKGISTRKSKTKKYYVLNELKGNREEGIVKSLQARGFTKQEMRDKLGLPIEPAKRKQFPISSSRSLNLGDLHDTSRAEERFVAEPLPTPPVPGEVQQSPSPITPESSEETKVVTLEDFDNEMNSRDGLEPPKVSTPGVPELPKAGFNIMEER